MKPSKMYLKVLEIFQELYQNLAEFRLATEARANTIVGHTDQALFLRELTNKLDDLRVQFKKEQDIQEKLAVLKHTQALIAGDADEKICTEICTATPDVQISVTPPKRMDVDGNITNEYYLLMSHVMIPPQLIEHNVVKPDYNGMKNYCTLLAQRGLPLPEGVSPSKEHTIFGLKMRRKAGVDLATVAERCE